MNDRRQPLVPAALLTLWALSLTLPVATTKAGEISGLSMLLQGWLGPLILQFSWYANPILLMAYYAAARAGDEASTSLLALGFCLILLAIQASFWNQYDAGGSFQEIGSHEAGYFCWLAAVYGSGMWLCRLGWRNRQANKDVL